MLKYLLASSLATYAYGAGVASATWNSVPTSLSFTVTDPIGTSKNFISVTNDADALITYVGLFVDAVPSSHTVLATGGPVTKVTCGSSATCTLPLYRGTNLLDPVPAGPYNVLAVNGNDLNYATAVTVGSTATIVATVNPYISAWGSTLAQTASAIVERGDDVLVTFDGLGAGDVIELRADGLVFSAVGYNCPVDFHTVTAAEAALVRNTIALKTANSDKLNGFAFPTTHTIAYLSAADITAIGHDYTGLNTAAGGDGYCSTLAAINTQNSLGATWRSVDVRDTDTINVNGENANALVGDIEAGVKVTVNYALATATTLGTYVGLWNDGDEPLYHTVSAVAGHPISVAFLPVGVSGAGSIQLKVPITAAAGNYIVGIFNSNDAYARLTPLAPFSYKTVGDYAPVFASGSAAVHNTDIIVIAAPSGQPSGQPTGQPSGQPSGVPTSPTGEPTGIPTSSPSFVEEPWGEYVWTEKRHRKAGMCENQCSGHGTCEINGNCKCFQGLDGEDEWTGPDCSSRTCPFDFAWVGASINSNNLHPWAECSNKGICDRDSGECQCFTGYEGAACQRTVCPDNCNDQGTCWPEKHLASKAGRVYEAPWDAMKHVGCLCDAGYRGPACDQQECPSGADPLAGYGNEAGRDCSGRGICDYSNGICACFTGFFGTRCQHQTTVM